MADAEDKSKAALTPNREDILAHLWAYFGPKTIHPGSPVANGLIEVAWSKGPGEPPTSARLFSTFDLPAIADFAVEKNSIDGQNVYIGATLRRADTAPFGRSVKEDFLAATACFVDLDKAGSVAAAVARAKELGLRPSYVVQTGTQPDRRAQAHFILAEPLTDPEQLEALNKLLIGELDADKGVWNSDRLIRLGGTISYPSPAKRLRGYVDEVTQFKPASKEAYTVDQLTRVYGTGPRNATAAETSQASRLGLTTPAGRADEDIQQLLDASRVAGQWHHSMLQAVATMIGRRYSNQIIRMLCAPYCDAGATDPDLDVMIAGGRKKWNIEEGEADDGWRPVDEPQAAADEDDDDSWGTASAANPPPPLIELVAWAACHEEDIPPRDWIVPGLLLRSYVTMIVAPGGAGKSLFTIQLSMAISQGRNFGGWFPRGAQRVLILNAEDDPNEMNRRRSAAARAMGYDAAEGMLFTAAKQPQMRVLRRNMKTGKVEKSPFFDQIRQFVIDNQIDVLVVDPLIETFEGFEENSNGDMNIVLSAWRDLARDCKCSVMLVHHTGKGASATAGDANAGRGASAITAAVRISMTLMTMSDEDRKGLNLPEDFERHRYVRLDDAKANLTLLSSKSRWYEKLSINLNNGRDGIPADEVGALVPWTPPGPFGGASGSELRAVLTEIDRGEPTSGDPYSTGRGCAPDMPRWAGRVYMRAFGVSEAVAKNVIKIWLDEGTLFFVELTRNGREVKGLKVDWGKAPGLVS